MDRHVGPQRFGDPITHPPDLVRRVVLPGHDQVGDLQPDVALVRQPPQRIQDRLQMAAGQPVVELLAERLEIDVGRVHHLEKRPPSRRRNVPVRHGHRLDAPGVAGSGRVDRVFGEDDRIVVSEGDASTSVLPGRLGNGLGIGHVAMGIDLARPRAGPVLAELAAQVAAGGAEREDRRAGIELVERLLLDRVDAEARAAAVRRGDQPAIDVLADEAEASLPRRDHTASGAQVADELARLLRFVPPPGRPRPVGPGRLVRRQVHVPRHAKPPKIGIPAPR